MASAKDLLQTVQAAPDGPQIAAIFDFDGTIIAGYSATVFIREQLKRGDLSPREFVELMGAMTNFGLGNMGFSGMMAINAQFMRGIDENTYHEVGQELYVKQISRLIYPESRALVDAHIAKGHTVAIISSATPYQVEPAAADLGIEHVLCTHLEVENGKFTGSVIRPTCFGQGKVDAAEDLASKTGSDLDKSFFYSDSTDDLLLLERVGHPRALNPSSKLRKVARDRGWKVANFGSRGRPSLGQFVRSVAATVSLVPSFAAGLPIYALTGSRRDSTNFSMSLFADTASALIGLDLNIKGEKNIWSHRPAVFVFNHQSKADVVIIASLLRRDLAGIGKKEIKKMPVIGKVLEMGGVVMIDRENAGSAIEAMTPLVDVMINEGKSVVLAPEGTRSIGPRLAPFKKGAFHLAMQAGVPMVPVVIRNAGDVAPKGDFVFRPGTVDVEVLEPVDTSDWQVATIDQHVREVRNQFLKALGQPLEKSPTAEKSKTRSKTPSAKRSDKTGTKVKVKAAAKAKTKQEAASKSKAKTQTKAKTKAKAKPKSSTLARTKAPAKATAKTKAKSKRASGTKTAIKRPAKPKARPKSAVKPKLARDSNNS
jgi:putative phosphoserine phosphatase/1-acylglycerol-3-phosphate O-acyltransferase